MCGAQVQSTLYFGESVNFLLFNSLPHFLLRVGRGRRQVFAAAAPNVTDSGILGKAELQMSSLFERRATVTSLPLYHSGHLMKKRVAEKVRMKTERAKRCRAFCCDCG